MSCIPRVTGIVLAAGKGSRMGQIKQLLPFRGRTMLEWVVDNALASTLQRVIVVLGYQADVLEPLLKERAVTVVFNPRYDSGQSSSLKAGLRAVTNDTDAVLFLLADQPLVATETINRILMAHESSPDTPVVLPVFGGKRGNPVLFSRELFPRIAALQDDCGARPLFEEFAGRILALAVDDPFIHFDIDTQEDYQELLRLELQ